MYYIHKDYLGSFQSITNEDGELVEKLSFDPCSVTPGFGELAKPNPLVELIPAEERSREGRRRNPDDWSFNNVPVDFLFDRGYTGHQHLVAFGLINMNGRVYDPYVARFLSPDPFVQNPNGRQGLNRYSYVENNPLKFTDPSGYTNHPMSAAANNYICYEAWGILSEAYSGPLTSGSGNHWSDEYSQGVQADFNRMSRKGFDKLHGDGSYNKIIDDNPSNEDWGTNGYWITVKNNDLIGEEGAGFIKGPHIINKFISIGGSAGGGDGFGAATSLAALTLAPGWNVAFGEPTFWGEVAMGVATLSYATYIYLNSTSNYPKPWYTDRPNNYIPAPLNGPNNKNYFPQGNGNDFIKWTIRLGGASVLGKKLYDGFNYQPHVMPADNTNVIYPTPPPPFYTPIPNPNWP